MRSSTARKFLGFIGLYVSMISPAFAGENVKGFQNFHFGLRLSEVEEMAVIAPSSSGNEGNWYRAEETAEILGKAYSQNLLFDEEKLIQVNVSRKFVSGDTACTAAFDKVFAAVRARYGDPDQPPKRKVFSGISAITDAAFTGPDGSSVKVASIFLSDCTINVAYVSSPGGSGF